MKRRHPRLNLGHRDPYNRGEQISNRHRSIQSPSDRKKMNMTPQSRRGAVQPKVRGGKRRYTERLNTRMRRTRCCGG